MEKQLGDALIGQLAADAALNQALLIALMELHPTLHSAIEAKVAATAPGLLQALPAQYQHGFQQRLAELRQLMRNAHQQ